MARPTLLDLTQRILSAMDSDSVNSISDTSEAEQVADIIRETYLDIVEEYDLKTTHTIFKLNASGTVSRPTHMSLPEGYHSVEWLAYDKRTTAASTQRIFTRIPYKDPLEFVATINTRNNDDATVDVISDPSGVELLIRNDTHPSCWTTFNGTTFVFDSYDSSIDTTLQSSKSQAYGQVTNDLSITDTTVINLPQELYNLLRNQARETCFEIFKDGAPEKIKRMADRARIRVGRTKNPNTDNRHIAGPNYGRRRS